MTSPLQRSGRVFLLADINAAYCSIETLFQPWWRDSPVVVLSSNDGNIVARNSYAKALGVKMGQPWHEIAPLYRAGRLHVFSSNFALYADISDRFMAIIARETSISVPYSIDEVWVEGGGMDHLGPLEGVCQHLRQAVDREIGIPIAIGAGHTKTQALSVESQTWLKALSDLLPDLRK